MRLPNQHEQRVIIDFLRDSTNVWVENVHFERPVQGGVIMKCRYRDVKDETLHATIYGPACEDFEDACVHMSDLLEHGMTRELGWFQNPEEAEDGATVN